MLENAEVCTLKEVSANPAPLGLLGFGMTTVLLNLHNAGCFPLDSMILGVGLFYGGLGQVIVGCMEWKKNNTFGMTAFGSYGLFWLSLVFLVVAPKMGLASAPTSSAMAAYLAVWGLVTVGFTIATLKMNRATQFVFGSLVVLFFMLAVGDYLGNATLKYWAGIEGIICGLSAIYLGLAQVINEVHGKTLLPVGV